MRRAGFTLVEVLVALVVTVAALTVLAQGFTTGARASVISQNATRASLLAQRVLTDLETAEVPVDQGHAGVFDDEPDFRFEVLSETSEEPGVNVVRIAVFWIERNAERTYVLTRLIRERTALP